jgi:hypothetical protein
MDLEETEDRNDCAGEDQQQFNRPTDRSVFKGLNYEYITTPKTRNIICPKNISYENSAEVICRKSLFVTIGHENICRTANCLNAI